jgi:branched-chain amino acid transport system substrate-binding protein
VPLFTYRTGPFASSGIPIANGMRDYLTMLNERDGGIGGVKIQIEECETGYNTAKGLECYEAVKPKKPVLVNPWSTGITLPIIPKAAVDKIPVLSMAYGLSASARGNVFPWIFNPPATYWDGMSQIVKYIGGQAGGLDKLKGKKIGYLYLDAGYGKEPIPLVEQLAKDYGFEAEALSGRRAGHAEPVGAMAQRAARQARLRHTCRAGARCSPPRSRKPSRSPIRWTSSSRSGGRARTT